MSKDQGKLNSLKRQLQDILNTIDDNDESSSSAQSSSSTSSRGPSSTSSSSGSSSDNSFASRAINNFRRAFPALSRPSPGGPVPKRRNTGTSSTPFFIKNTFTATFCCLDQNSTVSPTTKEQYKLSCDGLGKKRHSLDKNGNHQYVQMELEKTFPRLKAAGGKFQLYRTIGGGSGKRTLHKIPIGPQGYTTKWLSDDMAVGGACMYVVPFQKLPKIDAAEHCQVENTSMPTVTCDMCGDAIKLNLFEDHECQMEDIPTETLQPSPESAMAEQIEGDRILAEQLQHDDDGSSLIPQLSPCGATTTTPLTLQEALEKIRVCNDDTTAKYTTFFVQRSRVWNNVVQELKDSDLRTYKMSVEFIGECAADTGGPTRELFSLVYRDVINGKLTRGSMPNLTFTHDQSALVADEYKTLGQLVALAFLNNASLPHFFSPTVAHYILGTQCSATLSSLVDEIPADQVSVKEKLNSLLSCETPAAWNEVITLFDERFDMGITKATIPIEQKDDLVRTTNKHIMISCVAEEIFSFQEGLSVFGVLDALRSFPEEALKYFVFAELTAEDIRGSFIPNLAIKGSSKRQSEETIIFNFNQFLKNCARGNVHRTFIDISSVESDNPEEIQQTLSLHHVLQFMSGASHLPPHSLQGSIQFIHDAGKGQRVKANTCALQLSIPVNHRYLTEDCSVFISNLADDIFESQGYGCV